MNKTYNLDDLLMVKSNKIRNGYFFNLLRNTSMLKRVYTYTYKIYNFKMKS